MTGWRYVFVILATSLGLAGCADVNWQGAFDDWAESICREEGYGCRAE